MQIHFRNFRYTKEIIVLAGILLCAVVFRLFLMKYNFAVTGDEPHFLQLAISLAKGKFVQGLHPYWPPFYPTLIAVFSFLVPNVELAARVGSILSGVLVLIPIYFLTKRIFNKTCAYISTILLAIFPSLAFLSTSAKTEPTFIFLVIMGVYCGWKALESEKLGYSLLAAILFGFSYLTKPEGMGYFAVFLFIAGVSGLFDFIKYRKKKKIINFISCFICFVIITAPYLIYLKQETGKWTISSKILANAQFSINSHSDSQVSFSSLSKDNTYLAMDAIYHQGNFLNAVKNKTQATVKLDIFPIIENYGENLFQIIKHAIPNILGLLILMLIVLGIFGSPWRSDNIWISLYLLSFVLIFWFLFIPLFFLDDRYFMVGLTICFIWTGKGVVELINWTKESLSSFFKNIFLKPEFTNVGRIAAIIVIILVFAFSFLPEFAKVISKEKWSDNMWDDPVELKEAGLWLKKNVSHTPVLMNYMKTANFYAGIENIRKGYSFSIDRFDRILAYARAKNVEYMVVSERYLSKFPNLKFLFNDEKIPDEISLVYELDKKDGAGVRIFKVN